MAMYGVLRQFEVNALVADALVRSIDRDCVPLVDDVPGFVSSRLIDTGTGKILWLTTFDGEAPARTSVEEVDLQINEQLGGYLAKPPQVLVGRVHARRSPELSGRRVACRSGVTSTAGRSAGGEAAAKSRSWRNLPALYTSAGTYHL